MYSSMFNYQIIKFRNCKRKSYKSLNLLLPDTINSINLIRYRDIPFEFCNLSQIKIHISVPIMLSKLLTFLVLLVLLI